MSIWGEGTSLNVLRKTYQEALSGAYLGSVWVWVGGASRPNVLDATFDGRALEALSSGYAGGHVVLGWPLEPPLQTPL